MLAWIEDNPLMTLVTCLVAVAAGLAAFLKNMEYLLGVLKKFRGYLRKDPNGEPLMLSIGWNAVAGPNSERYLYFSVYISLIKVVDNPILIRSLRLVYNRKEDGMDTNEGGWEHNIPVGKVISYTEHPEIVIFIPYRMVNEDFLQGIYCVGALDSEVWYASPEVIEEVKRQQEDARRRNAFDDASMDVVVKYTT